METNNQRPGESDADETDADLLELDTRITLGLVLTSVACIMGIISIVLMAQSTTSPDARPGDTLASLTLAVMCLLVGMLTVLTMPSWSSCPYWPKVRFPWEPKPTDDGASALTEEIPAVHADARTGPETVWSFHDGERTATLGAAPVGPGAYLNMESDDPDPDSTPMYLDEDELKRLHVAIIRLLEPDGIVSGHPHGEEDKTSVDE